MPLAPFGRLRYPFLRIVANVQIKTSFLNNMSHEIRTPLHAIMSMSRMLLDGKAEGRKRALQDDVADLTHIVKSSETLESLVNDILLLSKIQATGFHLDYHTANLSELIEDTMELLGTRAIDRHIELVVTLRLPEFYFEASDLAELLMVRLLWIHCG